MHAFDRIKLKREITVRDAVERAESVSEEGVVLYWVSSVTVNSPCDRRKFGTAAFSLHMTMQITPTSMHGSNKCIPGHSSVTSTRKVDYRSVPVPVINWLPARPTIGIDTEWGGEEQAWCWQVHVRRAARRSSSSSWRRSCSSRRSRVSASVAENSIARVRACVRVKRSPVASKAVRTRSCRHERSGSHNVPLANHAERTQKSISSHLTVFTTHSFGASPVDVRHPRSE